MNKKKVMKTILIIAGIAVVAIIIHLTANNLIPFIQQLHGR